MKFKYKSLVLLFIAPLLSGCLNNIDFDQVNLDVEPIIELPLVSFTLDQLDFYDVDASVEIERTSDVTDLDIFQSSTFQNDLLRFDAIFEINQDFGRIFTINIEFLNDNDMVTFAVQPLNFLPTQSFLEARTNINISDFPNILNTTQVRVRIRLLPIIATVDPDVVRKFEFKSYGIFYFRL